MLSPLSPLALDVKIIPPDHNKRGGAQIKYRTFQIIEHFAQKNEKLIKCVANQLGSISLAEKSSNST